ncbi:MAG TPA: UDP-N-acetylmuramoyl-L-alanyl-D-glutamate--2,6-diaminopimelate ligase [Chloroflexi bacterium]|nr:UDP-N-acetylmuramoyl-L-alanyl-D-glutamate--2,6-diaminopimelate ligase [Chloroflexota bacterium]
MPQPRPIFLSALLRALPYPVPAPKEDVWVSGIASDSRKVRRGDLFVAIPGVAVDGHRFIPAAVARGAAAVVGTRPEAEFTDLQVPYIRVRDAREALAYLIARFYGNPAHRLTVIGVTGTDGKTTTANFIFHILKAAGIAAGMISTVNAVVGERVLDTGFHTTTPPAPETQAYLAEMVEAGLTHAVLEATSHGLAQHRVTACEFDIGVVTNITHEHLDYHGSREAYFAAKARLFDMLAETPPKPQGNPRLAVLNRDDEGSYAFLTPRLKVPAATYGLHPEADVRAEDVRHTPQGLTFTAVGPGFRLPLTSQLVGAYNVSNILAAVAATVVGLGIAPEAAREGVAALEAIPGRMERIDLGQNFTAIVDFAHTPNALRRALETARGLTNGRVIAVFGSAGLRDREKRRLMAEVSAQLADYTVLTAEDPRTESLDAILAEMAAGAEARGGVEGKTFVRVPDRREAIRHAVAVARPGDVVIVCGKGHEQSMCFGETEYPWDDRTALRAALAEHLGLPGPEMPYLPQIANRE